MYTYVQRPGCKKENTATYVYILAGSRTPTRAYVQRGLVYMAGSERRNSVVVVFMGRQRNASCSWGGNGMHRVHREATERVGANRLGRNGMRGRVHREGLDGTHDGNKAWRTAERRKRPCIRPATFEMGSCSSGGVWRTGKRTKRTSYSRNGGPVDREGCGVPQNGRNEPPTVETGVLLIGRGVAYRKADETDLCWSATVETGVLFIERGVAYRKTGLHGIFFISTVDLLQPPRAPIHPASTGSCSSSLHRALLHWLLFNHRSTVYCSSSPSQH